MNIDFKKENRVKKSTSYSLESSINLRKGDRGSSSRGRGRGRGRGRFSKNDKDEVERKPFDKSKIKCYNC